MSCDVTKVIVCVLNSLFCKLSMGGLIDYFSRPWRGSSSESVQDLVSNSQNKQTAETSLTNPEFVGDDYEKQSSRAPSELVSLPPDHTPPSIPKHEESDDIDDELFPERSIDVTPLEDGDRFQEINNIVNAIVQIYNPIKVRKSVIRNALKEFKQGLDLRQSCTFSQCFGVLRTKIHNSNRVELVCAGNEPLKLAVEEMADQPIADQAIKQSIASLNSALTACQKFKGEKELKLADIQYKLEDLHLMPLTKEGQDLYSAVNSIPSYLEEMSADIDRLHQQLYEARLLLRPK